MSSNQAQSSAVDLRLAARQVLSCLDLTSLNDSDTEADIARLCERAQSPFGPVAAVCVWPHLAAFARRQLPPHIAVAAVANFPDGSGDVERAVRETRAIVDAGAQEIDVVFPYRRLMAGDEVAAVQLLSAVRAGCTGLVLKVILETGVLADSGLILRASRLSLEAGADFLKTSTGKTPVSATLDAARVMLDAIRSSSRSAAQVGFKPSGGIRTVVDAARFMALQSEYLGPLALTPKRFRIGASSVLNDVEALLGGGSTSPSPSGVY